jgi:dynein heavy chain
VVCTTQPASRRQLLITPPRPPIHTYFLSTPVPLRRALRPDRLTSAMGRFVTNMLGAKYVTSQPYDLERSFMDSSPGTPIFVFLSPGVDVAGSVEALGRKLGFTLDNGKYASVSLGQGQEPIAMDRLSAAHKNGGWVLLQNIHLTIEWTTYQLDKKVDKLVEGAHSDFRLFLSAEPPPSLERGLPISLLQNSIKLTNEPPEGLKANLRRAWNNFNEEILEGCAKQAEFRAIVFALCYFHAALLERKKFGVGNLPGARSGIGWNMNYPFNTGDLLCCGQTANNYLENNVKVPWEDLRYNFGEIMYGGHIVEDYDRRLANNYLRKYVNEGLLENMEFFPGFAMPPNTANHRQVRVSFRSAVRPPPPPLAKLRNPCSGCPARWSCRTVAHGRCSLGSATMPAKWTFLPPTETALVPLGKGGAS